jgi:transposase
LPPHLARQTIIHDLKPRDKTCGECGGFLSLIGTETREQLEALIQKYIVKVHKRQKYACKCCQATVKLASAPHEAMEKGIAGPEFASAGFG